MRFAVLISLCLLLNIPKSLATQDASFIWAARVSSLSVTSALNVTATTMLLELMPTVTGGSSCYTQVVSNALVKNGILEVLIGPALPDLSACPYLEVTFHGQLLAPRYRLAVLPLSIKSSLATSAQNSEKFSGLSLAELTQQLTVSSSSQAVTSLSTQISGIVSNSVATQLTSVSAQILTSAQSTMNSALSTVTSSLSTLQTNLQTTSALAQNALNQASAAQTTAQSALSTVNTNATTTAQSVVNSALATLPSFGTMATQYATSVQITGGTATLTSLSLISANVAQTLTANILSAQGLSAASSTITTLTLTNLNLNQATLPSLTATTASITNLVVTSGSASRFTIQTLSAPNFESSSAAITTASISLIRSNGVQLAPQTSPPTCNAQNAGLLVLKQTAGPVFTFCACTGASYINVISGAACP